MATWRKVGAFLSFACATLAFCSPARADAQVATVTYDNPVVGFSLSVPEDWDMGTGVLGETVITINPRAPSPMAPTLSFFYLPTGPEEGAHQIAQFLVAVGQGLGVPLEPQVRATGIQGEWEVTATVNLPVVGEVRGRWLCRNEKGTTYVIGFVATRQAEQDFKEDIEKAFETCHLTEGAAVRFFREPTENAYRLMLPEGWRWEGHIYRDANCPGWFVFKAQSEDGLTGCFESPPVQLTTNYINAHTIAEGLLLDQLRKEVPDLKLEGIHSLPRAAEHLALALRLAAAASADLQTERAVADYVGSVNGIRVRIRVNMSAYFAPLMFVGGSENLWIYGAWAPVDRFDELYPLARGVTASLWETPQWRKNVRQTVQAVLKGRMGAMEESAEEWDRYLREVEQVKDPEGGDAQEVPYGPGRVWKDNDGKMYRVPTYQPLESELSRRGWKTVQQ